MHHIDLLLFLLPPLSFTAFVILPAICGLFFQPYRERMTIVSIRKNQG
jgi:hypothetical protein